MLRWLYIRLIWLHPVLFRRRFGDEMLDDFDRTGLRDIPRFFADATASLARQWLLRPEFQVIDAPLQASAAPIFQTIEAYKPRPVALLHGGLLGFIPILVTVISIGEGSVARPLDMPPYLPGSLTRDSLPAGNVTATVKPARNPLESWLKLARPYFASMPVLRALDSDGDFALSPWEIRNAPAALRSMTAGKTNKLTAEQCGLRANESSLSTTMTAQLRRQFMNYHPVLSALDADHDGEISAWEIDNAATALRKLDHNLDGRLTAAEMLPLEMAARNGLR